MLSKVEADVLIEGLTEIQEKAQATLKNLENNMRIYECQQTDFENKNSTPNTQMQAIIKERNSLEKMRNETSAMLEKVYSVSHICKLIIEEEHTFNKDFLDFLDRIGQQHQFPLRRYAEKLFKKFDKERKYRMMKLYVQISLPDYRNKSRERIMNNTIAKRIRQ